MNVSVFFPLRSGSKRIPQKNTRPFHPDGRSLFQYKLDQISGLSSRFEEVVISTNDDQVIDQFPKNLIHSNIRVERRPDELCLSTTKVQDLIDYVPTVTRGDWVLWLHATSPFVDVTDYARALDQCMHAAHAGTHDSIMSVNRLQQFIWSEAKKKVINVDRKLNPWPNTQDLDPLFEINHAFYINSRRNYLTMRDRIGQNPSLYHCEGLSRIDIDWPDDFRMAQSLIPCFENDSSQ